MPASIYLYTINIIVTCVAGRRHKFINLELYFVNALKVRGCQKLWIFFKSIIPRAYSKEKRRRL